MKDARTGEAVCGAALTTGDSRRWAISDAEGRFRLAGIDEPEVDLHVSCLGYVTQTLHLRTETPRSTVDIALRESNLAIDEVVVTAQRRSAESGSAYAIDRQTLDLGNGDALTTNQKHALFQLPFGVTSRYNWLTDSVFQPYVGMKLGACYAELSSYYYVVRQYTETWGFYLSPEVGVSIFPRPDYRMGIHVALYYNYATNNGDVLVYRVDNLNNFGLRVGISF